MRRLLTGECSEDNIFQIVDPTAFLEIDFEAEVVKALSCLFPEYACGVFAGTFRFEGERRSSDLALLHKTLSHWFVVEVELAGHSLDRHVLPQVRCFRYGEPDTTCISSLRRAFPFLKLEQANALLEYIPRYVAVVGNIPSAEWSAALKGLDVQYLTVSVYKGLNGRTVHEVDGTLFARAESLGFAKFSAIDNCLQINRGSGIPIGPIQIIDQFGNIATWIAREAAGTLWISKEKGPALLEHKSYVQLIRSFDGRISLRPSAVVERIDESPP